LGAKVREVVTKTSISTQRLDRQEGNPIRILVKP
jgi:hypothetical protein